MMPLNIYPATYISPEVYVKAQSKRHFRRLKKQSLPLTSSSVSSTPSISSLASLFDTDSEVETFTSDISTLPLHLRPHSSQSYGFDSACSSNDQDLTIKFPPSKRQTVPSSPYALLSSKTACDHYQFDQSCDLPLRVSSPFKVILSDTWEGLAPSFPGVKEWHHRTQIPLYEERSYTWDPPVDISLVEKGRNLLFKSDEVWSNTLPPKTPQDEEGEKLWMAEFLQSSTYEYHLEKFDKVMETDIPILYNMDTEEAEDVRDSTPPTVELLATTTDTTPRPYTYRQALTSKMMSTIEGRISPEGPSSPTKSSNSENDQTTPTKVVNGGTRKKKLNWKRLDTEFKCTSWDQPNLFAYKSLPTTLQS